MKFHNQHVLVHGPLALGDIRVQVVVPSFTALLSDTTREALGDMGPVFGSLRNNNTGQDLIFLLCPCALRKVAAVVEFEPAGVALDL